MNVVSNVSTMLLAKIKFCDDGTMSCKMGKMNFADQHNFGLNTPTMVNAR